MTTIDPTTTNVELANLDNNINNLVTFASELSSEVSGEPSFVWNDKDSSNTTTYTQKSTNQLLNDTGVALRNGRITNISNNKELTFNLVGLTQADVNSFINGQIRQLADTTNNNQPRHEMCAITENNDIYYWGHGFHDDTLAFDWGADITGDELNWGYILVPPPFDKDNATIKKVVLGSTVLCVLYEDGDVYSMGQYSNSSASSLERTFLTKDNFLSGPSNSISHQIKDIYNVGTGTSQQGVVSKNSYMAITTSGELFGYGDNEAGQLGVGNTTFQNTPVKAEFNIAGNSRNSLEDGEHFVKVTMASNRDGTTYALTNLGRIFASGYNNENSLGQTLKSSHSSVFEVIDGYVIGGTLQHDPAVDIISVGKVNSTNSNTCIFLTQSGKVYGFGSNNDFQLAQGNNNPVTSVVEIHIPDIVTRIVGSHTQNGSFFAITQDNSLYAWGANDRGCLGINSFSPVTTDPVRVTTIPDPVKDVYIAGVNRQTSKQTSFVVTTTGRVFTAGNNTSGQLGTGDRTNRSTFTEIRFKYGDMIKQISSSGTVDGQNTFYILLDDTRIYSWGEGIYEQTAPLTGPNQTRQHADNLYPTILRG